MTELDPQDPEAEEQAAEAVPDSTRDLGVLRDLLVGEERAELEALRERFDRLEVVPEDVSRNLPQAILMRTRQDNQLSKALTPTIEAAIETSVQRNPGVLVDAIFPVMGPAIRKSIREALASMVESVNRSVEHSLTPQGIRWRIEARRTGKPFAEIVLKHSLVFRVSEVFLVHRETALLLQHVGAPGISSSDPDMITSMLGAIQDFVSDSFDNADDGGIAQIEFGDRVLLIARSHSAILACVVRGVSTIDLKQKQQKVLERICAELGKELREFNGDDTPFMIARTFMEELLIEQRVEPKTSGGKPKNILVRSWVYALLIMGIFVLCLTWVISERNARVVWSRAQDSLNATPGVVLTEASRDGDSYVLAGLRDPFAPDPIELAREAGIDSEQLVAHFEPYLSLEPEMIEARSREHLAAPEEAEFHYEKGQLRITGRAPGSWIAGLTGRASELIGVDRLDSSEIVDSDREAVLVLATEVADASLIFGKDSAELLEDSASFERLRDLLARIAQHADGSRFRVSVEIVGHAANSEANPDGLRVQRARSALVGLEPLTSPNLSFAISVAGAFERQAAEVSLRCQVVDL